MKIAIIYPYFIHDRIHEDDIRPVPMGVYSVAAVLRENNYQVEILNWNSMRNQQGLIKSEIQEKKPDVIGISIMHGNRWGGIEIARMAKMLLPDVKIVFGGIGATLLWEHFLKNFPEIDFIVLNEGEYAFLELVKWLDNKNSNDPNNIKGVVFRGNGHIIKPKQSDPIDDLDQLPIPAEYFYYQHISTTRGCAWNCNFCGSPKFWDGKVRFRSAGNVVDELEMLNRKNISFFYISDDTLTIDKKRVIQICREIIKRGLHISWNAISRVDCVDEEILYWMRKAGCIQISYGVESGSEKIRNLLNKKIRVDDIKNAFLLTRKYGILPRAYFIYGSPGETWETIQETIDLIKEIKPLSVIFYILDIFPGTALYEEIKKTGKIADDLWLNKIEDIMYFEIDPELSQELILSFGKKLRESFFASIHGFVEDLNLIEQDDLAEQHADFYSRLGMTFSHGEYSKNKYITDKERIAKKCYMNSLEYLPNPRAYLGLGIIKQKNRQYEESVRVLSEGIDHFPNDPDLNLCIGISYLNLQEYKKANSFFQKCPQSKESQYYLKECKKALDTFPSQ